VHACESWAAQPPLLPLPTRPHPPFTTYPPSPTLPLTAAPKRHHHGAGAGRREAQDARGQAGAEPAQATPGVRVCVRVCVCVCVRVLWRSGSPYSGVCIMPDVGICPVVCPITRSCSYTHTHTHTHTHIQANKVEVYDFIGKLTNCNGAYVRAYVCGCA
jgi:hypothetical protein